MYSKDLLLLLGGLERVVPAPPAGLVLVLDLREKGDPRSPSPTEEELRHLDGLRFGGDFVSGCYSIVRAIQVPVSHGYQFKHHFTLIAVFLTAFTDCSHIIVIFLKKLPEYRSKS